MKTTATRSSKKQAAPIGVGPTQDEIRARAESIWLERGCPQGADEQIWLEAESQLRSAGERPGDAMGGLKRAGFTDDVMEDLDELYPGTGRGTTSL